MKQKAFVSSDSQYESILNCADHLGTNSFEAAKADYDENMRISAAHYGYEYEYEPMHTHILEALRQQIESRNDDA